MRLTTHEAAYGDPRRATATMTSAPPPRAAVGLLALLGVILSLSTLDMGLVIDDYHHRAAITEGRTDGYESEGTVADLFTFFGGDPQAMAQRVVAGHVPWWADPQAKVSFYRPLSAASILLDYALWPEDARLMHAHNLVWFGLLLLVVGRYYLHAFSPGMHWVALLGLLLFTLDDAHFLPVSWIAHRNSLIAGTLGVLALHAYHKSREERRRPVGAWLLYAGGLLAGEAGILALAYVVSHAIFIDSASLRKRVTSVLPLVALTLAWRLATSLAGYGARGVDFYIDPGQEPSRFLGAVAFRLPILIGGVLTPNNIDNTILAPPGTGPVFVAIGLASSLGLGVLAWPVLRTSRLARALALGMILCLVPCCATTPHRRMLLWASFGAMPLVALTAHHWFRVAPTRGAALLAARAGALLFLVFHAVLAPIGFQRSKLDRLAFRRMYLAPPEEPSLEGATVVAINNPLAFFVTHLKVMQLAAGKTMPRSIRVLSPSFAALTVERIDARTLRIRAAGGWNAHLFDRLWVSARREWTIGQRIDCGECEVVVVALTGDGRPAAIEARFEAELEDASLHWYRWNRTGFERWTPPAIGETIELPPAIPERG